MAGACPSTMGKAVEERLLIARVLSGDAAAARALYDAHVDRVYRLAFRMARHAELAEDLTQETFIRAFDRLADFRGEAALSTWLHAIAVSVILNGLRRVKRLRTLQAPLEDALDQGMPPRHGDPHLRDRLERAMDALPESYRLVLLMHDVEGYGHEEIGDILGMPAGTSRAQLSRARARLRATLAQVTGEAEA